MSNTYAFDNEDENILQDIPLSEEDIFSSLTNQQNNNTDNNNGAPASTITTNEEVEEDSVVSRILNSPDKVVREQQELQQYEYYIGVLHSIQTIMDGSNESLKEKVLSQSFIERHNEPTPKENDYGMMYLLQKNQSPKRTAREWPWTDDQRVNTVKNMRVRYWKLRKNRNFGFQMRRYVFAWNEEDVSDKSQPVIMLAHLVKDIRQNQAKKVIKKESK